MRRPKRRLLVFTVEASEKLKAAERRGSATRPSIMSKDTKASSMLRYEIHREIRRAGFESNVSVYEAIGALRICEHDLLRMLDLRSDNDTGEQLPDVMDEG